LWLRLIVRIRRVARLRLRLIIHIGLLARIRLRLIIHIRLVAWFNHTWSLEIPISIIVPPNVLRWIVGQIVWKRLLLRLESTVNIDVPWRFLWFFTFWRYTAVMAVFVIIFRNNMQYWLLLRRLRLCLTTVAQKERCNNHKFYDTVPYECTNVEPSSFDCLISFLHSSSSLLRIHRD